MSLPTEEEVEGFWKKHGKKVLIGLGVLVVVAVFVALA